MSFISKDTTASRSLLLNPIINNTNLQPWQNFHRPFVKDLAFALACPNALNGWVDANQLIPTPQISLHTTEFWQQQFHAYAERLVQLDTSSAYQDLTRYLMNRPSPYRLGFHFEGLMHFWLEDGFALGIHPFEVIAHNVQLYREKQTVGEIDFIIRNHDTGDIEHWELSIKFYLGSAPFEPVNWVGINAKDTLHRKLTHMQTKQFKTVWVDLDFYEKVKIDKRYAILKGRFFVPFFDYGNNHTLPDPESLPDWLNPNFPIHQWLAIEERSSIDIEHTLLRLSNDGTVNIRHAHYVEWFTQRSFYDRYAQSLQKLQQTLPLSDLETGLYFLNHSTHGHIEKNSIPLVIRNAKNTPSSH